jgi:hypothetical protein
MESDLIVLLAALNLLDSSIPNYAFVCRGYCGISYPMVDEPSHSQTHPEYFPNSSSVQRVAG